MEEVNPKTEIKNTEPDRAIGTENKEKNPKLTPEQQKQLEAAEARNKEVEREQREIINSLNASLEVFLEKRLREGNLSPSERARYEVVKKSILHAKNKLDKNTNLYNVEIRNNKGKVIAKRPEGIPVDELARLVHHNQMELVRKAEELKREKQVRHESAEAKARYDTQKPDTQEELKIKEAWYSAYKQLPNASVLKQEADSLVMRWENTEKSEAQANGRAPVSYNEEQKRIQLGEALRELAEANLKKGDIKNNEQLNAQEARDLQKIKDVLLSKSLPYFVFHYGNRPQYSQLKERALKGERIALEDHLTENDKKEQRLYTAKEAREIKSDSRYREMLLEEYQNSLPNNFKTLSPYEQSYQLAILALKNRRILNFPREVKVPKFEAVTDQPPVQTGNTVNNSPTPPNDPVRTNPTPVPTIKLENRNPYYDFENEAFKSPSDVISSKLEGGALIPSGPDLPPTGPDREKKIENKMFLIDISAIAQRMAETQSEERIQREFKNAGWFKSRVLKGLTEDFKRVKYYQEALANIKQNNSLMQAIQERASGRDLPGKRIPISAEYTELLNGAVSEYQEDVINTQREVGEKVNDDTHVQELVADLLYRYANKKWGDLGESYKFLTDDEAAELYAKEKIAAYLTSQGKSFGDDSRLSETKGILYASNFAAIAFKHKEFIQKKTQEAIELNGGEVNKEAILKHLQGSMNLDLQLGQKERDIVNNRPQGVLKWYEKAVSWAEKRPVLGKVLLNPFMIGAVSTATGMLGQRALKWTAVGTAAALGASGLWIPLGVGAAAGGIWRGFKRSKDISNDLAQEARHETLGGKGSEILDKKEGLRFNSMTYAEAMAQIDAIKNSVLKTNFALTETQKKQLGDLNARLELERDMLVDDTYKNKGIDFFKMDKLGASPQAAKAKLRIALKLFDNELFPIKDIQQYTQKEKGVLMDMIEGTEKRQNKFRRIQALKSGIAGAAMGFAGGLLAQEGMALGGRLIGSDYYNSHDTVLEKMTGLKNVLGRGAHLMQEHHMASHNHAQTATEWMEGLRGHVAGGNIEHIHTQDWYDNNAADPSVSHLHNQNELRMFINSHPDGSVQIKVPVQEHGSWIVHGKFFKSPDIEQLFHDGKLKFIIAPDGAHPNEAITFDVDPITKQISIPAGSPLRGLFDASGHYQGTGYAGLAEESGVRGDGSKNYTWVNSIRGNGHAIDYGSSTENIDTVINKEVFSDNAEDDIIIPTVPLTRKVYLRPEEKKKIEEEKARKKAEKERKLRESQGDHGHDDGHETTPEDELKNNNKPLFEKAQMKKYRDTFQKRLTREEKDAAEVDLTVIDAYWKEEDKAIKKAQAEAAKRAAEEAKKASRDGQGKKKNKKHGGHGHDETDHAPKPPVKLKIVHEEGPSAEAYLEEAKKLQKAVESRDKHFARIAQIDQKIRKILDGTSDDFSDDLDDLSDEFEDLVKRKWFKGFKPEDHKKEHEEGLRPITKNEPPKPTPEQIKAKEAADKKAAEAAKKNAAESGDDSSIIIEGQLVLENKEEFQKKYKNITINTKPLEKKGLSFNEDKIYETFNKALDILKNSNTAPELFGTDKVNVALLPAGEESKKTTNGFAVEYNGSANAKKLADAITLLYQKKN